MCAESACWRECRMASLSWQQELDPENEFRMTGLVVVGCLMSFRVTTPDPSAPMTSLGKSIVSGGAVPERTDTSYCPEILNRVQDDGVECWFCVSGLARGDAPGT